MEITIPTLIDLFVATKQIEGCAVRTTEWYSQTLSRFAEFAGNGESAKLTDVTVDTAKAYIAWLQDSDIRYQNHPLRPPQKGSLSPFTIHAHVRALKTFGGWLKEEGYTTSNLFAKLKRPKMPKPMIQILSDDEIDRVFESINPNCFLGSRTYVIVLLLLDTGIRASELCTLTLANTNINENYIKVCGKGEKERIVPFGATTKKALIRYVITFRPEPINPSGDNLVLSNQGAPLTYDGLYHTLRRLAKKAAIPRLRPHLFRHTFAVRYLMNGGDIMTLRLMLGHTDISTTQIYLHLAESHIQVQHNKFSPVDRLRGCSRR